jgi:hypothetical protein
MITADHILQDLEAYAYRRVLVNHPERIARACAGALFQCLFLNFRKQYMYVPTSDKSELHDRYESIWHDFNGRNHGELAIRHRLSIQQIYTITNQMRREQIKTRQQDLFPLPDTPISKPLTLVVLEDYLPADLQRAGLPVDQANHLASEIADYLCATYPGISIRITEAMWNKRSKPDSDDLFDLGDPEPA